MLVLLLHSQANKLHHWSTNSPAPIIFFIFYNFFLSLDGSRIHFFFSLSYNRLKIDYPALNPLLRPPSGITRRHDEEYDTDYPCLSLSPLLLRIWGVQKDWRPCYAAQNGGVILEGHLVAHCLSLYTKTLGPVAHALLYNTLQYIIEVALRDKLQVAPLLFMLRAPWSDSRGRTQAQSRDEERVWFVGAGRPRGC